ncbi:hypothetical protein C6499_02495 [Candidatus Poribacteria bacterium]|nr:MAG: hypothetical protein C6499_02495 [Candidatus Poribacteria bacterium]
MKFIVCTTILGLIFSFGSMTQESRNSVWAEQIAFVSSNWDSGKFIQEIWTIHLDGTNPQPLTNSPDLLKGWPTWSPDGTEIAFATDEGIGTLHLMDADSGNLTVLKKDYTSSTRPAWSPDGQKIAYGGTLLIRIFDVRTGEVETVRVPAHRLSGSTIHDVAWSPDGHQLAFAAKIIDQAGNSQARDVYVMNVDSTGLQQLTQHRAEDDAPAWSPDGQKIAFVSYRNVLDGGIFIMNTDGSNIVELTNSGEDYPAWSPDGTQLACTHFGTNVHIGIINVNGGDLKLITEGAYPSWQPNGLVPVRPTGQLVSMWGSIKVGEGTK